ncbi:hypothetical protein A7U60_g576 [Sanghuangporus baumii]|uniref:Uncharacterized protein n=1 Tax=Sanghuangporus baumii TaxID=108892 RepID=A0A9Q5I5M1_SANBA|nr:hypothetical protein A7U60_g576 [Sanghuangporus baumii]
MPLTSRAGLALFILLHFFSFLPTVLSSVFITHPYQDITCSGGSECTVTWADDGRTPLLADIGPSDFALYQGTNTLVQQLAAGLDVSQTRVLTFITLVQQLATGLDVSQTRVLTFIPNRNAGPNANSYWIKMTSLSAKNPNDTSQPYTSFSGFFTLDNMSGAEGSPIASLTTSLPISGSSTAAQSSPATNGIVGTTTLPGVIPTGSASTLSSALSALSAISSAASGSLSQLLTTSSASHTGTPTGTSSASTASAASSNSNANGSNRCFGHASRLMNASKLSAALALVLVTTELSLDRL